MKGNWTDNPASIAEKIHEGWNQRVRLEEDLDEMFGENVDHISTDSYDNSLEVYFLRRTPTDWGISHEEARKLALLGFFVIWLNFADGTEQVIHCRQDVIVTPRRAVTNPKWHGGGGVTEPDDKQIDPTASDEDLDELLRVLHKLKRLSDKVGLVVEVDELIATVEAEVKRRAQKWIL